MNSVIDPVFWDECDFPPSDQALFDAVNANDPAAIKARLDAGVPADQMRGDAEGKTPVIRAIEGARHGCLRVLLDSGADVHLADTDYRSPLRWALHKQDIDSVGILLEHGADPYYEACSTGPDGKSYEASVTDLFIASQGDPAIAQIVAEASRKFKICEMLRTARAGDPNDIPGIAKLLDEGCPVNVLDEHGRTALMYACTDRYNVLVKLLLDHGADPEMSACDGETKPLYLACVGRLPPADPEIVQMLIDHGANPRFVSKEGYTYMHAAATSGSEAVMKLIAMHHGASVTAETKDGQSPLGRAIEYGNKDAIPVVESVVEWHKGYLDGLARDATQLNSPLRPSKRLSLALKPR